jgi:hypothetical protein
MEGFWGRKNMKKMSGTQKAGANSHEVKARSSVP